ncbi:tRNA (adenosine(37)-N6)-threonylcarbamoyltransferase complex ATPase subunit type 1 TsaE [Flavobacteriaceae bacterium AU392]|nr:tRNA (adenosine(37)-N6)-threonylcarbamoyltransferase complex ATPase subunit type 1 TsaE [Flavobacteriaceae bacterium]RKM85535.1 tRNA (adenosine(37)-N6)-threonylcarbamoyltransferase complex ATPase subunit type 1 TsaE [Flavobacteriaceae bacterium AU392]
MTLEFDIEHIDEVAKKVLQNVKTKTILFYGEMGVGKTTFINALVNALGGNEKTSSPTFSLVNEYEVKNDLVYHFDFYRIENEIEVLDIGIEDYFYSGRWNFIEWPERISRILPFETEILELKTLKNGSRALKLVVFDEINKK